MRSFIGAMVMLPMLAWAQPATRAAAPAQGAEAPAAAPRATARSARATPDEAPTTRPARTPSPAQAAQQQRMRDCNAEARNRSLSGAARSAFMRPCLGGNMPTAGS